MPDQLPSTEVGETNGATAAAAEPTAEELKAQLEAEKKRANQALGLVRKRDADFRVQQERVDKVERELQELRATRAGTTATTAQATGDDAEPNRTEDPIEWLAWCRRQDKKENDARMAQFQMQSEADRLNNFAISSETQAKAEIPDYDQARAFLVEDYRKELKLTGELDLTVDDLLTNAQKDGREGQQLREAVSRVMAEKGCSEREAAEELSVQAAYEYRRQRAVRAAARHGGNPAKNQYELAKHRGWKGAQGTAQTRTTGVVDDSLKEMERRRNLQRGTQTVGGVQGAEPHDDRVWTYDELAALQKSNPKEAARVAREIAAKADENPGILEGIIRH